MTSAESYQRSLYMTTLELVPVQGSASTVRLLLEFGADPNVENLMKQ